MIKKEKILQVKGILEGLIEELSAMEIDDFDTTDTLKYFSRLDFLIQAHQNILSVQTIDENFESILIQLKNKGITKEELIASHLMSIQESMI